MSYSTSMYVHNWGRYQDFLSLVYDVAFDFGKNVKYELKTGYWVNGELFEKVMLKQFTHSLANDPHTSVFVFVNHDGETDAEVLRCFVEFAKLLVQECSGVVIEIMSDVDHKVRYMNPDHGIVVLGAEDFESITEEQKSRGS